MKILMINNVCGIKSTGRICTDLATELENRGHTVRIAYGRGNVPGNYKHYAYKIGSNLNVYSHACYARIFDAAGFGSKRATKELIQWIDQFDPDVIHLNILHGYYINIQLLFQYIKTSKKKVIWTLHDCWQFTGHCCYFDFENCNKWKKQCHECQQKHEYPSSLFLDASKANYERKKELFAGIDNMYLVAPSKWLAGLVSQSILSQYPVYAIPNWIDLETFANTPSDIRKRYHIDKKFIVLGVASAWEKRKGLEDFFQLEHFLSDDYQIVLVGLTDRQMKTVPKNLIGICQTSSKKELAELYSAADVFVNPSHEDNYPTTQIEAIACGTPVVAYDVGGCKESAELYGTVVPENDIRKLAEMIQKIAVGDIVFSKPNLVDSNHNSFEQYFRIIEGIEE